VAAAVATTAATTEAAHGKIEAEAAVNTPRNQNRGGGGGGLPPRGGGRGRVAGSGANRWN